MRHAVRRFQSFVQEPRCWGNGSGRNILGRDISREFLLAETVHQFCDGIFRLKTLLHGCADIENMPFSVEKAHESRSVDVTVKIKPVSRIESGVRSAPGIGRRV